MDDTVTKANDDYMCIALDSKVWRATMLSESEDRRVHSKAFKAREHSAF